MEFSLYGREGGALVDGVAQFKYLGIPWIRRMMTVRKYGGTSNGRGQSGGYWAR